MRLSIGSIIYICSPKLFYYTSGFYTIIASDEYYFYLDHPRTQKCGYTDSKDKIPKHYLSTYTGVFKEIS